MPSRHQQREWGKFLDRYGVKIGFVYLPFLGLCSLTIRDLVNTTVACHAHTLVSPQECWTEQQIREVIKSSIFEISGIESYSDHNPFATFLD